MLLFKLAQELGLEVTALQDWLKERNHAAHADPLARLDEPTVAQARSVLARPAPPANRSVTGLRIEGFKAFGSGQQLPLAPITLVFGPNSSGKSSVLQSLLWANHAATTGELDIVRPRLAGESVNLGSFDLMRFRREGKALNLSFTIPPAAFLRSVSLPSPIQLHLSFGRTLSPAEDLSIVFEEDGFSPPNTRPRARDDESPFEAAEPRLERVSLDLDGAELLRASWRSGGVLRVDKLDFDHPFWRERVEEAALAAVFKSSLSEQDRAQVRARLEKLLTQLAIATSGFTPGAVKREEPESGAAVAVDSFSMVEEEFIRVLQWLMDCAVEPTRQWLASLHYLGPLRSYPDRGWALTDQRDAHWLAGGGEAWEALKKSKVVRDYVNQFLAGNGSGYAVQPREYIEHERATHAAQEHVEEILRELGPDESPEFDDPRDKPIDLRSAGADRLTDMVIYDLRNRIPVSPRDIGVGISQVVPVLAMAYGLKGKTILIEQPEIHVHPKLQAELGDVFLRTALFENLMRNRYIIETHSEHLILRILKRIRQTTAGELEGNLPTVRPEDVCVIYAEPTKEGTKLHRLRITPDGDFADRWPNGFFAERSAELFT